MNRFKVCLRGDQSRIEHPRGHGPQSGKVSFWANELRDYQLKISKTECKPVRGADCFGEVANGCIEVLGDLTVASLLYTEHWV